LISEKERLAKPGFKSRRPLRSTNPLNRSIPLDFARNAEFLVRMAVSANNAERRSGKKNRKNTYLLARG
jgi:hypothetical protein